MNVLLATAIVSAVACSPSADTSSDETASDETSDETTDDTSDETDQSEQNTSSTGSTCPSEDQPTYENFGEAFMDTYCTRCHSSAVTGIARNGATPNFDFDTLEGIVEHIDYIEDLAAAGPKDTNTLMPPSDTGPSLDERKRLGQWLSCLRLEEEAMD